jgi:hypothetical protein
MQQFTHGMEQSSGMLLAVSEGRLGSTLAKKRSRTSSSSRIKDKTVGPASPRNLKMTPSRETAALRLQSKLPRSSEQ